MRVLKHLSRQLELKRHFRNVKVHGNPDSKFVYATFGY
jgi:hypothetical protein